jgi:phosphoribosyl 1,2-cyclic phosphodiesterase
MNIIVLNSGSNGNAVYVESPLSGAAVLLDCGISCKQIETRLKIHGRFLQNIQAVFITHEHGDHIRGLTTLQKKRNVPVFLTRPTHLGTWNRAQFQNARIIGNMDTVQVKDLTVHSFPKSHDAADPVFFKVECNGKSFLYITDLGIHNEHVTEHLKHADGILLESNYDVDMLWNGGYPEDLKARVASDVGHLSNEQAIEILLSGTNGKTPTVILGHVSENNNTPELVREGFERAIRESGLNVASYHVASRHDVSDVICI